jgi:uncharacterized membrane protein
MPPDTWSKLHGASTHFPIALMLVSALCDGASIVIGSADLRRGLRFTSFVTLLLGTLGSYAAVASGLVVTKGQAWGHATMLRHHQFVWPAFVGMFALAVWRAATFRRATETPSVLYLLLTMLTALLVGGAGYWGGELLNQG